VRILHVNKFLYRRGGAEGYMFDLAALQREGGHEVAHFGMAHPENEPMPYARYFPTHLEFEPPPPGPAGKARGVGRMLWSTSAKRGIEAVLDDFGPHVVHLHNVYHQLSPSVLAPLRRRGIGALMTLHDYKLACPTYRFLDHGRPCEACLAHRFWEPIRRRCNAGSLGASAANAVELSLHTLGRAYEPVGVFACPSRFLEGKMRQGKVFPDRLRWIPNFVDVDRVAAASEPGNGRVVFAGRLSDEKGVDTLVEAVAATPGLEADIAGDGPRRPALEALAATLGAADRITLHGRLPFEAVQGLVRASSVAVCPSRWYENQPLAVLEAFACGRPVVGTGLGGIPELIEPGVDGAIVPPNDPHALGAALHDLADDPARAHAMGAAARAKVERAFPSDVHLERLWSLYDEARDRASGRPVSR
jgi:glycosyltransferase involved in cell wall biosynthesis